MSTGLLPVPPRIAFLGSPPFAVPVLERLIQSPYRPLVVVTAPERAAGRGRKPQPSPIAELAELHGIECLRPTRLRPDRGTGQPGPERLRLEALDLDLVLVASYGELLDAAFLALPRLGCLNVHGSLLPRHRGASPVQAAILAGDPETGVSMQRMVVELDAGDLLLSKSTPIGADETAGELFERLALLGGEALVEALDLLSTGRGRYSPQDPTRATHCRKLDTHVGRLDWSQPAEALQRAVRAYTPWPGARMRLGSGPELKLLAARVGEAPGDLSVGELLSEQERLWVGTGDRPLELLRVQPAGRRPMEVAEYLRGTRLADGERLLLPERWDESEGAP